MSRRAEGCCNDADRRAAARAEEILVTIPRRFHAPSSLSANPPLYRAGGTRLQVRSRRRAPPLAAEVSIRHKRPLARDRLAPRYRGLCLAEVEALGWRRLQDRTEGVRHRH